MPNSYIRATTKNGYTTIEKDEDGEVMVKVDLENDRRDIIEVHVYVPVLDSWQPITTAKSLMLANELINKYFEQESNGQDPSDANFKLFA